MPKQSLTPIDVDAITRTGVRGRLDRLLQDYATKAQALKIVVQLLDDDDRALAVDAAPKKFLQAINARNSHAGRVPVEDAVATRASTKSRTPAPKMPKAERIRMIADYLRTHDGASTRDIGDAIGVTPNRVLVLARRVAKPTGGGKSRAPMTWSLKGPRDNGLKRKGRAQAVRSVGREKKTPLAKKTFRAKTWRERQQTKAPIHGEALTLFLLEHLDEQTPRPLDDLFTALAEAGSPLKKRQALNGPLHVSLISRGYVRLTDDGFQRTAKGTTFAQSLRSMLETRGKVASGRYSTAA